jgi:hypothetical protein
MAVKNIKQQDLLIIIKIVTIRPKLGVMIRLYLLSMEVHLGFGFEQSDKK